MQSTQAQLPAAHCRLATQGRRRPLIAGALLALLCGAAGNTTAHDETASGTLTPPGSGPALDRTAALRDSQAAVGRAIGDYALRDREGQPIRLSSYRGKPLLVSFIYTGCFQVCPTTTRTLQKAVSVATDALGAGRFNVISIGFNQPEDSPQALKSFRTQYGINAPNWEFLSPPAAAVPDLARDFGFSFVATPAGFDHLLQVSVVDARGRIYRQIYGDDYSADHLIEPLRQLIVGAPVTEARSLSAILDQVRILCSVYDPRTGKYRVSYGLVLEIAGGATFLLWIIWFFLSEWLKGRRAARRSCA